MSEGQQLRKATRIVELYERRFPWLWRGCLYSSDGFGIRGGGTFLAEGEYATGLFGVMVGVTFLLWPLLPSGSKPFVATVLLAFWFLGGYLFWDWDSGDYAVAALIAGIVAFFFTTVSWGQPRRASGLPAFSSSNDPNTEAFVACRFPAYPRAVHLCQQRVYAESGSHITWEAFTSKDPPAALVDHYRRVLGDTGFIPDGEGGTWRYPPDARTTRVLTVLPTYAPGPHHGCGAEVPSAARSVEAISQIGSRVNRYFSRYQEGRF